jgi:hypothetical protein
MREMIDKCILAFANKTPEQILDALSAQDSTATRTSALDFSPTLPAHLRRCMHSAMQRLATAHASGLSDRKPRARIARQRLRRFMLA